MERRFFRDQHEHGDQLGPGGDDEAVVELEVVDGEPADLTATSPRRNDQMKRRSITEVCSLAALEGESDVVASSSAVSIGSLSVRMTRGWVGSTVRALLHRPSVVGTKVSQDEGRTVRGVVRLPRRQLLLQLLMGDPQRALPRVGLQPIEDRWVAVNRARSRATKGPIVEELKYRIR